MHKSGAILFTGHLPDLPDRQHPRLTEGMVPLMRQLFRRYLKERKPGPVFLSLAAGADLLFADEALTAGFEIHAVLPCAQGQFLRLSVWPYEENAFYSRLFEKIRQHSLEFIELAWENQDQMPDFRKCNDVLMDLVKKENSKPEAVVFLEPNSISIAGGSQDFVQQLAKEGFQIHNLYPDLSREQDPSLRNIAELMPVAGKFEELDKQAIFFQQKWKSGIRLSLTLFAVVIVLSAFDSVGETIFGDWAVHIKNMAVGAALLAAILEMFLNPRKGSGRKEWITNRAKAEKLRQEFWLFLFANTGNEAASLSENLPLCMAKASLSLLKPEKQMELYHRWRVADQSQYFDRKVETLRQQLNIIRTWQRSLLFLGVLYGLIRLATNIAGLKTFSWMEEINLLACLTGIAVVLGNYQESVNTEDLYFQYREMAKRLKEWESKNLQNCKSTPDLEAAVRDAESLLAAQNNEWSIRLS